MIRRRAGPRRASASVWPRPSPCPSRPRARPQVNDRPVGERDDGWRGPQATSRARRRAAERSSTTGARREPRAPCRKIGPPRPADEALVGRDRRSWRSRRGDGARSRPRVQFAAAVFVEVEAREPRHVRRPAVPRSRRRIATSRTPQRRAALAALARRGRRRPARRGDFARPRRGRRQRLSRRSSLAVRRRGRAARRRAPRPAPSATAGLAGATPPRVVVMRPAPGSRRRSLLPPRGMRRDGAVADATDGVRRDRVAEPLPRSRSGRSFFMDFLLVRTSAISALSC